MSRIIVLTVLISILFGTAISAEKQEVISQIRLKSLTKQQYLDIRTGGFDIQEFPGEEIEIYATPGDLQKLRQAGVEWEVIHPNLQDFYVMRSSAADNFGGFLTFSEIAQKLDDLHTAYPTITTAKYSIGTSVEGMPLWVMKVSDNPETDEEETEVLYISLIHAREPAGAAALLYFLEYLLSNYGSNPDITDLLDNRELFFLPVQNPDGYLYNELTDPNGGGMWRKNRRDNGDGSYGIDLNRNYSYMWGYDDGGSSPYTSSPLYRGTSGFSEPETENVADFIVSRNFSIIHNFHCWSNLEIWAPGYDRFYGPDEDLYQIIGDSLTQYNGYDPGVGWTLYPTNGDSDDWAWGDTLSKPRIISMTVEIGDYSDGFWPDPSQIPTLCEENLFPNLFLAQIADDPYRLAPPKKPVVSCPESSSGDYTVSWTHDDDENPAVSYRLTELTGKTQYLDDVEADYGYWETEKMVRSPNRSHSGTTSWHTFSESRAHHWLISQQPYDVKPSDELVFWAWWDTEEYFDYFYVQISSDGGYSYENLPSAFSTNDDPFNMNLGNGITGESGAWLQIGCDLSAYEGEQVLFRFSYFTDDWTLGEGVYIDDIENIEMFSGSTEISSSITETYYDFTSKPDGEYWYVVSATDAEGQEGRVSEYAYTKVTSVVCCVINGDIDHSGDLNPMDAVRFANYFWRSGAAPVCMEEGDIDGDGDVDPLDAVKLVNYFWRGGAPPVDCHPLSSP